VDFLADHAAMKTILSAVAAVTFIVAPVAWLSAVYCMFMTVANRKPGIRLWHDAPDFGFNSQWWLRNPWNHILATEHLTDRGRMYRRRLVYSILAFIVPILLTLVLGSATGNLNH
jgi:hypothetical protein